MKGVDHRDEVLVRDVVHDAVTATGNPTSSGLENFHVVAHVALDVGRLSFHERLGYIDISEQGNPRAVPLFIVSVVDA